MLHGGGQLLAFPAHFYVFGDHVPGKTNVWEEFQEKRHQMGYDPEVAVALEQKRLGAKVAAHGGKGLRGAIGTPDQLREFLRRYEECGIDQVIFIQQAGRNRHEDIMESLELFGKEILPEFKDRDEANGAQVHRTRGAIEAAIPRVDDPHAAKDYVIRRWRANSQQVGAASASSRTWPGARGRRTPGEHRRPDREQLEEAAKQAARVTEVRSVRACIGTEGGASTSTCDRRAGQRGGSPPRGQSLSRASYRRWTTAS